MLRLILPLLTVFIISLAAKAQQMPDLATMEKMYREAKNDSAKIQASITLGYYYQNTKPDDAFPYFNKAIKLTDKHIKTTPENYSAANPQEKSFLLMKGSALRYRGITFMESEKNDEAMADFSAALAIYEAFAHKKGIAYCQITMGIIYSKSDSLDQALKAFSRSATIFEELGDEEGLASGCLNLGMIYHRLEEFTKAENNYLKAISGYDYLEDNSGLAECYTNLGITQETDGRYDAAIKSYKAALQIREQMGDKPGKGLCLNHIALIYWILGNFDKTSEYLIKNLEVNEEMGNQIEVAGCYVNLSMLCIEHGSNSKGLEYSEKALKIFESLGHKRGMAVCIMNNGIFHAQLKQYDQVLPEYQKALEIYEEIKNQEGIAQYLINTGMYYNDILKDYDKSIECYTRSLRIREKLNNKNGISLSYTNLASAWLARAGLHKSQENPDWKSCLDTALIFAQKSMDLAKEIGAKPVIRTAIQAMSYIYWGAGDYKKAMEYMTSLTDINNTDILMNFSFAPEQDKESYFSLVIPDYWLLNSFALLNKDKFPALTEIVCNNTIRNKSLLLKSGTAMRNAVYNSKDTALTRKYEEWISLRKKIAQWYSNGMATKDLEDRANTLEGQLQSASVDFSEFSKAQQVTWRDVQKTLREGEAAIEFVHFKLLNPDSNLVDFTQTIQYAALIITPGCQYPFMVPLCTENQLADLLGSFKGNNLGFINGLYGSREKTNTQLYNLIWKPLEEHMQGVNAVYLSPSGLLHKVSFPAIARDQKTLLCDIYDIGVSSGTGISSTDFSENKLLALNNALMFGGIDYNTEDTYSGTDTNTYRGNKGWTYLAGTKTETEKITLLLEKNSVKVNYFSNKNATEENFKKMAVNSSVLHIATHGFFYPEPGSLADAKVPEIEFGELIFRGGNSGFGVSAFVESPNPLMRSGLALAGANDVWRRENSGSGEDGVLTAQEVSDIDMRGTELVVLSACETGLGDIKGSEGVYGLQRAFKIAGVRYIIMSLWQVPDQETVEFMELFYSRLIASKDVRSSFNYAQKEMRKKYDPFYWGAFVLIE